MKPHQSFEWTHTEAKILENEEKLISLFEMEESQILLHLIKIRLYTACVLGILSWGHLSSYK